jgi:hypothetical protein
MQYAWCMDKLLIGGYEREAIEGFLKRGEPLPLSAAEIKDLTCKSCGAKPYRAAGGRLMVGCPGTCTQRMFADLRDDAVQERARKAAHAAASGVEVTPMAPRQRGLWKEED